MRSLLFVPGDSERKLAKGFASEADVVIVDLEDSVALTNKEAARATAASFIAAERHTTRARIFVRVNDLSTGLTDDDLAAVVKAAPNAILLPKSNSGRDVQQLSSMLRVHEAEADLEDGAIQIAALITETPGGIFAGGTYAGCSPRLAGLTWGAEDLSAALGARTARDGAGRYTDAFRLARAVTLLAAAAADVPAIDTVFPNFRDMIGFEAECAEAERDGFTAKMAIHPDQVPVINTAFTPSTESLEHATAIIEAFSAAGNPGVVAVEGKMYDRPHLKLAQRLLARIGR
jgi:citrate lyase subunit beta/citryl-CoA lyase